MSSEPRALGAPLLGGQQEEVSGQLGEVEVQVPNDDVALQSAGPQRLIGGLGAGGGPP